jgi:beta-fructofuranosidase
VYVLGNPKSCDWGDICWGHYTSRDGLRWTHNSSVPMLSPDRPYDDKGIFTGCLVAQGVHGEEGVLTAVYSSVTALPIHWTLEYTRNCAGLALATSSDGGRSWQKRDEVNPVLEGEPEGLKVTGFRDPELAAWPAMDAALGEEEGKTMYGVVSGGIVDQGPNAFVYKVSPGDLTTWTYIGPLVDIPTGYQQPSHWTGDFGLNWECVNFMTLRDESLAARETQVLIMGTEGGLSKHPTADAPHAQWSLWLGGSLSRDSDGEEARLQPEFSGVFDIGCFYAANSYEHPVTGRRIVWGWIREEAELSLERREEKGWAGYLSLQREVFLFCKEDVVGTVGGSRLEDIPAFKVEGGGRRRTVQTMGVRPAQELASLRKGKPLVWRNVSGSQGSGHLINATSTGWELEAVIRVQPDSSRVGLDILHNGDKSRRTRISFSPSAEEIVVDRSRSNDKTDIGKGTVSGPFTLFVTEDEAGKQEVETLRLRVFSDGDVLEIFANDRFALSTVVYVDSKTCNGVSWFAEAEADIPSSFESISIWEDLASIQE